MSLTAIMPAGLFLPAWTDREAPCRDCGETMRAKLGTKITHHCAHFPGQAKPCSLAVETAWHLE